MCFYVIIDSLCLLYMSLATYCVIKLCLTRRHEFLLYPTEPALMHVHDLPRFNGHSSAAETTFDLSQDDPIIAFGVAARAAVVWAAAATVGGEDA